MSDRGARGWRPDGPLAEPVIKSWVDFFLGGGVGMLIMAVIAVIFILWAMKWK